MFHILYDALKHATKCNINLLSIYEQGNVCVQNHQKKGQQTNVLASYERNSITIYKKVRKLKPNGDGFGSYYVPVLNSRYYYSDSPPPPPPIKMLQI